MKYPERALGDVLTRVTDMVSVIPQEQYETIGIYSYGRGIFRRPTILGAETNYGSFNRIHGGDFIYSKLFGWEGALAVIRNEHDGLFASPEFPTFKIDRKQVALSYLTHLAMWPTLHQRLRGNTTGMGSRRQRVNVDQLLATTVPLPDIGEQQRIAARLDAAMAKLTRVSELRGRTQHMIGALRESLVAHAPDLSRHKVRAVMTLVRRPVIVDPSGLYREIGIRSFGRGVFHKSPVTGAAIGGKRVYTIEPGDLLFSSVFAWEGAVARVGKADAGRIGSHRFMTYVVSDSVADADYLRFFFLSAAGLDILRQCSPGGAGRNKTLGIASFDAADVSLPPLPTQRHIARMLLTAERISNTESASFGERADVTRLALLNAAFAGRL